MLLETGVIALGILGSFFLKDINLLALNNVYPDFLLIFVIYFSLRRGEFSGIWIGFFAGLLEDSAIISFSERAGQYIPLIGTHMLYYCLIGYVLGKLNRIIDRRSMLPVVVVVLVTSILTGLLIWFTSGLIQQFDTNYFYSVFKTAVYTALLSPIWFWLLGWVYRYTREEGES